MGSFSLTFEMGSEGNSNVLDTPSSFIYTSDTIFTFFAKTEGLGGLIMRCGAKCFLVEIEVDGKVQVKSVNARTSAEARKQIRKQLGQDTEILTVKEEKKKVQ